MVGAAAIFMACNKVGPLAHYNNGSPVVLSSSVTTFAPKPADSSTTAIALSWTNPGYATDSNTVRYLIQVDSAGKGFGKAKTKLVTGTQSTSFTAKEFNDMLLGLGFNYNVTYSADVRIISSYANNNDQQVSNIITLTVTPYVVPPKVTPPSTKALFLVGSATAGGWGNPVPVSQQFTKIDSVTYEGTFYLNGGGEYLLLPLNGNWDHKFSVANKSLAGLSDGGDFGADLADNIPGPATTGTYKIHVDFQHGIFSVTQVKAYGLLYVPGDYQGWAPATAPKLGSTNNDGHYDGYVFLPAVEKDSARFKFTPAPNWDNSFGDAGGGKLSGSGDNIKVKGGAYYHLKANTTDNTWSATPTTWGVIGSFAASGWNNDVPMTYDAGNGVWKATITVADGDQFKFRANGGWDLNYGDNGGGKLEEGGGNIGDAGKNTTVVKAGTYTVTLFLNNAGYYTYMIQ